MKNKLAILFSFVAFSAFAQSTTIPPNNGRYIGQQIFTSTGAYTYNADAGTNSVVVEVQGAGAGGAGCASPGGTSVQLPAGGGGGGWLRNRFTSNFNGATGTVGAAGSGGASGANDGTAGGNSTFVTTGSVTYTAFGGSAGLHFSSGGTPNLGGGEPGGDTTHTVDFYKPGGNSGFAVSLSTALSYGSQGGTSMYSGSVPISFAGLNGSQSGFNADGFGGGGGGAVCEGTGSAQPGGNGTNGIVIIKEYS